MKKHLLTCKSGSSSLLNKLNIFRCMSQIHVYLEFQEASLKFHTKYLSQTNERYNSDTMLEIYELSDLRAHLVLKTLPRY